MIHGNYVKLSGVTIYPLRNLRCGSGQQMAFFQNRSLSLVDMYIDTSEPTENVGEIQFSLEYNFNEMTLILRIMQVSPILSNVSFIDS